MDGPWSAPDLASDPPDESQDLTSPKRSIGISPLGRPLITGFEIEDDGNDAREAMDKTETPGNAVPDTQSLLQYRIPTALTDGGTISSMRGRAEPNTCSGPDYRQDQDPLQQTRTFSVRRMFSLMTPSIRSASTSSPGSTATSSARRTSESSATSRSFRSFKSWRQKSSDLSYTSDLEAGFDNSTSQPITSASDSFQPAFAPQFPSLTSQETTFSETEAATESCSSISNLHAFSLQAKKDPNLLKQISPGVVILDELASKRLRHAKTEHIELWCQLREAWWTAEKRHRLSIDLSSALSAERSRDDGDMTFDHQFTLKGKVFSEISEVRLSPALIIFCGTKRCKEIVDDTLADLSYLTGTEILVVVDKIGFLSTEYASESPPESIISSTIESDSSQYPPEQPRVYIQSKLVKTFTGHMCGNMIQCRDGGTSQATYSTIGGTIAVGDRLYALTTAHALFRTTSKEIITEKLTLAEPLLSLTASEDVDSVFDKPVALGPVAFSSSGSYVISKTKEGDTTAPFRKAADFALIDMNRYPGHYPTNHYINPESLELEQISTIQTEPESGPVFVLLYKGEVLEAFLVRETSYFVSSQAVFETMTLYLDKILTQGSSGAWVVRGNALLGYVFAGSGNLPRAHMLPIGNAFQHIKQYFLQQGFEQPEITIPNFVPPALNESNWRALSDIYFEYRTDWPFRFNPLPVFERIGFHVIIVAGGWFWVKTLHKCWPGLSIAASEVKGCGFDPSAG